MIKIIESNIFYKKQKRYVLKKMTKTSKAKYTLRVLSRPYLCWTPVTGYIYILLYRQIISVDLMKDKKRKGKLDTHNLEVIYLTLSPCYVTCLLKELFWRKFKTWTSRVSEWLLFNANWVIFGNIQFIWKNFCQVEITQVHREFGIVTLLIIILL
jgi:hypothetical protein